LMDKNKFIYFLGSGILISVYLIRKEGYKN